MNRWTRVVRSPTDQQSQWAAAAVLALCAGLLAHAQAPDVEARIEALLARMTLDEKLGQLQQLAGTSEAPTSPSRRPHAQGPARIAAERPRRRTGQRDPARRGRGVAAEDSADLRVRRHSRLPDDLPDPARRSRRHGIRRPPNSRQRSRRRRPPPSVSNGRSRRWSISRATRGGAASPREPAKIRISAWPSRGPASAASRGRTWRGPTA